MKDIFYCPAKAQKEAIIGKNQFCDFVLRSFDHSLFALVSAKRLLYWAKRSV